MELKDIQRNLSKLGAKRIIIKQLANNDNSKQQIYLGGSFKVVQILPSEEIYSSGISKKKGPIFKAPLSFYWLTPDGGAEKAPGAQLILYPKYPEVRFSGFLQRCKSSPRHLMQPPTKVERLERQDKNRILFLGVCEDKIIGHVTHWDDPATLALHAKIDNEELSSVTSVFYSLEQSVDTRADLLNKLRDIYKTGHIPSQRIKNGEIIPYEAMNGAGFTLESLFGISPNGVSEPDFEDWELKAHSGSVVTLMTPEPNQGEYITDLELFLRKYGWSNNPERLDFASSHKTNLVNDRTGLTLKMQGYDPVLQEIIDPDGGLHLVDDKDNVAAGWSFSKILEHWKRKHARTCFVTYTKYDEGSIFFQFGPQIRLAEGAGIKNYLKSLYIQAVYYDPGINMKFSNGRWKAKKRSQFRIKWKDIEALYDQIADISLDEL